ncbi:phospholipase A2 inhibitor and Ly6/PLAUR domain-containing protein-like [Anomaloglossus baeobatrachus]|uniref:phospholipase A2 inhibitor and Ly6/PLAUR domain-containing protein-like n=1 Tax=Anomaloglossus baeobatrachus TaxID=238106 RepID=UPI003F4FF6E9
MMRSLIVSITIFCAILWTGDALCCQQCKAVGEDCSGKTVECENENDVCAQAIEYDRVGGEVRSAAFRGCWNLTVVCNHLVTVNTTGYELDIYYDCCETDGCNSGPMEVPPRNTTENGLYCKSCFVEGSYDCPGYVPIACTGDQGDCLEFHGDATFPGGVEKKYGFAGCTITGACYVGFSDLVGTTVGAFSNLTCPEGNKIYFDN